MNTLVYIIIVIKFQVTTAKKKKKKKKKQIKKSDGSVDFRADATSPPRVHAQIKQPPLCFHRHIYVQNTGNKRSRKA